MILKNGMELLIEHARPEDARELVAYLNLVGGESDNLSYGANEFKFTVEEEMEYIRSLDTIETATQFIGRINGEIVCTGGVRAPIKKRLAHRVDLGLSVKKAFWNLGIGRLLLQRMIDFAKENGKTEIIHLNVKSDNTFARRLYESMGFEEVGVYENYIKIDEEYYDMVLMNLFL